jgi:hypothetical protein
VRPSVHVLLKIEMGRGSCLQRVVEKPTTMHDHQQRVLEINKKTYKFTIFSYNS